jgi:hypothetical protein
MENINEILENNETDKPTQEDSKPMATEQTTQTVREFISESLQAETKEAQPISKIETRGRHKKDCNCDKCKARKGELSDSNNSSTAQDKANTTQDKSGLNNPKITDNNPLDLSEFKKVEISSDSPNPAEVNASKYLTGSLILIMIDAVLPTVIVKIMGMINPKYKSIKTKQIKLSKEQKEDLEPLANEVVKTITVNMSPTSAFVVCLSLIYGSNILILADNE